MWLFLPLSLLWAFDQQQVDGLTAQKRPSSQFDLATRFFLEYPKATSRLEQAISQLQATGRYRKISKADPDPPWIQIKYFLSGDRLRFHQFFTKRPQMTIGHRRVNERVVLYTPTLSAIVYDPFTANCWTRAVAREPARPVTSLMRLYCWRFLKATYCLDGVAYIDRIKDSQWVISGISSGQREGKPIVTIDCNHKWGVHDEADAKSRLVLSPTEDWAARRLDMVVGPPFNLNLSSTINVRHVLGDYFVKDVTFEATYGSKDTATNAVRKETQYFQLSEPRTSSTPDAEFKLSALGLGSLELRSGLRARLIWWVAGNAVFLFLILAIIKSRRRHRVNV